ncbi:ornithine cyclodeaminase family protein [Actinomadura montaniterrae]|uniref:Ornithine cyclodeaminase family protein n=1 Tax=Actinomadura montaniterrae TaxID=1803903 RepID=A0A6L3VVY1_9ACTN|nr:ornithine cyclodeaminase family protein [Actinomadura montaniterrae]KAB2380365.1 ornithine cyclodeaminase family protein [Actinomadura montaniterrae]
MTDPAGGVLVLDRAQTRAAARPEAVLEAVRAALVAVAAGEVSAPPRVAARSGRGLLGAMPGHVPGLGLSAKLVAVFPGAAPGGHGSHRGIVAHFDPGTGRPLAIMDAEAVTAVRTAAAATVAMRALARPGASRIAVIGTGTQARAQIELLAPLDGVDLVVGARDLGKAERLVAGLPGASAAGIEAAVRSADAVFCCTSSREPVLRRSWLRDGAHLSSVGGSDGPEFDAGTLGAASLFVEWPGAVTEPPPAGAWELQGTDPAAARLIGDVLAGRRPGRRSDAELTLFKSTGHAALDVAAASVVYCTARERGLGIAVDL